MINYARLEDQLHRARGSATPGFRISYTRLQDQLHQALGSATPGFRISYTRLEYHRYVKAWFLSLCRCLVSYAILEETSLHTCLRYHSHVQVWGTIERPEVPWLYTWAAWKTSLWTGLRYHYYIHACSTISTYRVQSPWINCTPNLLWLITPWLRYNRAIYLHHA